MIDCDVDAWVPERLGTRPTTTDRVVNILLRHGCTDSATIDQLDAEGRLVAATLAGVTAYAVDWQRVGDALDKQGSGS